MLRVTGALTKILAWRSERLLLASWLAALALFVLALFVRLGLGPLHGANPALTFYPAILLAAVLFGWQQGLAVLALSVGIGSYLFVPPGRELLPVAWTIVGGFNIAIIAGLQHLAQELAAANERQRILFQELQHRVANTLQSVIGTFEVVRKRMDSSPAEAARLLESASARFNAAAEVHRRLNDPALFERGLDPILQDAVATAVDRATIHMRFAIEPLCLTFDQMSTITLLVIEAANNAQKHVFRHGRGSVLEVSLKSAERGRAVLSVRDDGPGLVMTPAAASDAGGLGLRILEGLARQIEGRLQLRFDRGTEIRVEFPLHAHAQSPLRAGAEGEFHRGRPE